eukprot:XP_020397060.1 neural Wiskott-Aldrich syndrome protein-like [Zea mays]
MAPSGAASVPLDALARPRGSPPARRFTPAPVRLPSLGLGPVPASGRSTLAWPGLGGPGAPPPPGVPSSPLGAPAARPPPLGVSSPLGVPPRPGAASAPARLPHPTLPPDSA